jgi:hypothetical protein
MSRNSTTANHDMYLPRRRARTRRTRPAKPSTAFPANGTREQKFEWMREKQRRKAEITRGHNL